MAVPDFQSLMLPLLTLAADEKEHPLTEAREALATQFKLSEADRAERLASGKQYRFSNRVAWAKVYLTQAGLLSSSRRGHFQITARGQEVLKKAPSKIDIKYLEQFPEFQDFRQRHDSPEPLNVLSADVEAESPEEALEAAHLKMRAGLAAELLAKVKDNSPQFFERLVVELLKKMGYGNYRPDAGQATGKSGDEGIDGVINEDRLGLDTVYLQAKKWEGKVGRPEIQKFVGALHGKRARKGVFLTTGSFSEEARSYVEHIDPKVVLIDGVRLVELMIECDIGVSSAQLFVVKKVDSDFFEEDLSEK
jgi:restriction system protein